MLHLSNALLVVLLWTNLTGLALVTRRVVASWPIARVGSPVALVAALFFVEHFAGLGRLGWVWPFTTALSVWLIAHDLRFLGERWRTELIFSSAFLYALAWRYAFPDIDASSEKITDLTFVANYTGGAKLPPVDRWLPPFAFDMYYGLQHYAAALIGRVLDVPAGTAYNLGFCTVIALASTAAGATAMLMTRRRFHAALLTAAFVIGGVGTAPVIRMIARNPPLHASVRFIGSYFTAENATTPFGQKLVRASHVDASTPDLPVETFSYLVGLGDFHPPLAGYLLLMLGLLAIAHMEAGIAVRASHAVLAATVPLMIAANTWQFPLQAALAGGYFLIRSRTGKIVDWRAAAIGFGASLVLIEPFLAHFGSASLAMKMALRLVPAFARTPPLLWALTFYPIVLLLVLQIFFGDRSRRELAWCLFWIALLAFAEIFYIDDLYSGKFERFNSVLKWWAWTYSGGMLMIGGFNLRARSRVCRWGTVAVLVLVCAFSNELAHQFFGISKPHFGQLDGAGAVREDAGERVILDVLRRAPPSIVLQRIPKDAYVMQPVLTMLAGQTAFLGWPGHEDVWRGYRADIDARRRDVDAFYRGELGSAWLKLNQIRYVLWLREDNTLQSFDKVDAAIEDRFAWRGYYEADEYRVGLWEARQ
jgi:uncharacterized membrane protein